MKYYKFFLIFLVYNFFSVEIFGQIPQKALEIPVKYLKPEKGVSLTLSNKRRPNSFWVVFSDKAGNETYENATGKKIKHVIGFLDDFYVAEETDKRVHIVKDTDYKEGFSASAEDFGWIDKKNLLLWNHCIITKSRKINKKGMVINTIESLKNDKTNTGDEEKVNYFYDSHLTKSTAKSSKVYDILYIYKIKDDAILLGVNYVTDVYHAKDELLGWVSAKKIAIWDNRIAIEPNWDKEAARERKEKNIKTTFFIDISKAKLFAEGKQLNEKYVIWNNDTYEKRNIGNWRRFPLLSYNKETKIIKAGVITTKVNENTTYYIPAYTSLYVKGLQFPLYKYVLFMNQFELADLLNKFDALADAYSAASNQRQRLKEVWLKLLQSYFSDDLSIEEAENMTFEKINNMIFGLPGSGNLLHVKLGSLTDRAVVSDTEFNKYIQNIKDKRLRLSKIFNNANYIYGFYSYDKHYFWISQDLLP